MGHLENYIQRRWEKPTETSIIPVLRNVSLRPTRRFMLPLRKDGCSVRI